MLIECQRTESGSVNTLMTRYRSEVRGGLYTTQFKYTTTPYLSVTKEINKTSDQLED